MALTLSDPRAPPPSPCIGSFDEESISCSPMNDVRFNLCPTNLDLSYHSPDTGGNHNIGTRRGSQRVEDSGDDVDQVNNNGCSKPLNIGAKWTEEDTNNSDNMFLVETNEGESIFIFVKEAIIQEKDCITGDPLRSFDLNNLDYAQFLDDEEPRLKLTFKPSAVSGSGGSNSSEVCYTFEDEESLSQFKDQFIAPFINEEYLGLPVGREVASSRTNGTGSDGHGLGNGLEARLTSYNINDIPINFFGTEISIPIPVRSKSNEGATKGASWTEEDVENSEDMFLVENKEKKTVFLFVKDNIIHEKDCVTGDVKINHDLNVLSNAVYPGDNPFEVRLSFDSRVQSKKEARYIFEDQESFTQFKQRFIEPSLVRRNQELSQKRKRFECLRCGFTEMSEKCPTMDDNKCPQCASVFTFFNSDFH